MNAFGAAAPVRLDLAGGWTDVPPYSVREGGVVVAAAVQLYAYAEVRPRERGYLLASKELEQALEYTDLAALSGDGPLPLQRAGLRLLQARPCALSTHSDAPHGSGLGSSGAMDVAMVTALAGAGDASSPPVRSRISPAGSKARRPAFPGAGRTSSSPRTAASSGSGSATPKRRSSRSCWTRHSPRSSSGACCSPIRATRASPATRSVE